MSIFFHIDVNSAFLSWSAIQKLNKGSSIDLREIPSIIGGDSSTRHGIVLAKSIPAKAYGIETAEPIVSALRKCPNLYIEPSDHGFYEEQSELFVEYLRSVCPDIEQVSIDECYMDFTPIASRYPDYMTAAALIKDTIQERFHFTVNVGISDRKVLAKMASDFQKPNRIHTLFHDEIQKKMWPLPVNNLFMCGKSSAEVLNKLGILTIGDLAKSSTEVLTANLKGHGILLYEYANGIDASKVQTTQPELKGVGNSTTLPKDIIDASNAYPVLLSLAESVSSRLRAAQKMCSSVTVEIKYATFSSCSRQVTLSAPTNVSKELYQTAIMLFDNLWDKKPIRLLGLRTTKLSDLTEPIQLGLFDSPNVLNNKKTPSHEKYHKLDLALDEIKRKFGKDAVKPLSSISGKQKGTADDKLQNPS